jgi:hypothetical protein
LAKEILACEAGESIRLADARLDSPPLIERITRWGVAYAPKAGDVAVHLNADDRKFR